ncbi:nuclear transport factor 2 family protein [Sneathiella aquimaris]|uniref:nuclear transport factor 2 family protein n=1 Tax=Sneathiella aquimaris TaxID=2599305 RepID=UPI00146F00F7|nr:nuclear transport factor 2 family protein [Sneathiella aquimaris]
MENDQSKELIEGILGNIIEGKIEHVLPFLAEDVEVHICLGNQLYTDSFTATFMGHKGAMNFVTLHHHFLDLLKVIPTDFHQELNKVIVRGYLECRLTISGEKWISNWMQIWTFEGDQIRKIRMFSDFKQRATSKAPQTTRRLSSHISH